jgi:ABC-2 type transport system permease protein
MKMGKIFAANLKMIYRDKISLFWALVFPLLFVALFGLFSTGMSSNTLGKLAFIDQADNPASARFRQAIVDSGIFDVLDESWDMDEAKKALRNNDASFAVIVEAPPAGQSDSGQAPDFMLITDVKNQNINSAAASFLSSVKQQFIIQGLVAQIDYVLQQPIPDEAKAFYSNLKDQLNKVSEPIQQEQSGKNPVKYFDMIFIGLLCMGVMNYAITGFAINLSSLREQKILKRLLTTPLPIGRFMVSEILAFIVLAFVQVGIMLAVGVGMFGAHIYGGWWFLFALSFLGALLFLSFGFMVAAFAKSGQAASGMANSIAIPLMFLSGVFFPLEALPNFFYQIFRFLPLSPMIQAMRSVCLEGDPVSEQLSRILIMVVWLVVIMAIALKSFRFGDE